MAKCKSVKVGPEDIERLLGEGNLPQAEIYCRMVLQQDPTDAIALYFLGWIAESLKLPEYALSYYSESCKAVPEWDLPRQRLAFVKDQASSTKLLKAERYLLIKAWGFGFWADVYHVLGQLLLAEITHRVPVVHWGTNSLFGDWSDRNAFELYFEPVSSVSVSDLENRTYDFFPPKWNHANLRNEDLNKWQGPYSRMAGLYFLNRPEKVAVSDFYTGVLDLEPWIPVDNSLYGLGVDALSRHLIGKYMRPRSEILRRIEGFYTQKLASSSFISVHVRGSDKVKEMSRLEEVNRAYFEVVDRFLLKRRDPTIFLLTDDKRSLAAFVGRYGNHVITAECQRTEQPMGLHYQVSTDKCRLGVEVMVDTHLAARAQAFIGNGFSNVSTMVGHLKEWDKNDIHLFEANVHHTYNTMLHDRTLFRGGA
jgi:protein O-GlcNAc transferase